MQKLGQHFLTSKTIAKKIAGAAHITQNDMILEIGPGEGMLTDAILEKNPKKIIAVEKDKRLVHFLQKKYRDEKRLEIIEGDILKLLPTMLNDKLQITNYKVVANIPYYLTSFLIRLLLQNALTKPKYITLMVQKEVAERIVAKPPHMNLLALSVQSMGNAKIAFRVPKTYFKPQPKVDSAVIVIKHISEKFFKDTKREELFELLHCGFGNKRKMLIGNLSKKIKIPKNELEKIFMQCGIDAKARAENLSLEQWKCIFLKLET